MNTWSLPQPAPQQDMETLPPPPSRDTEVKPTFEIPITENSPPGLLGFGPAKFVGRKGSKPSCATSSTRSAQSEPKTQRMVLLTGPAGVGKSHLAEWLCEDAHERGVAIPLRTRTQQDPNGPSMEWLARSSATSVSKTQIGPPSNGC